MFLRTFLWTVVTCVIFWIVVFHLTGEKFYQMERAAMDMRQTQETLFMKKLGGR